ncbi:von willebrand domain-containing protein [Gigaspora margarita]|uniref:von willebrand domain-containing protein n=1 Tax=Gigaspora margarita TaxID=4874 RepID=A0A8H3XD51_GIGMA|nr:von willebrand domain-containing protein [Gigaspora margarita]
MLIYAEENNKNNRLVPLRRVEVNACVVDMIAEVNIVQVYKNLEEDKIEAVYRFTISNTAAVCGFEATIDGKKKVIGIVKEAEQAKREYKEAIKQGHGAYLLEEQDSDVFKCSVGNIMHGQKVEIKIKYMIELQHDAETDSVRFILPSTIAPKYGSYSFNHKRMHLSTKISDSDHFPLKFFITCRMSSPIYSIESPSHPHYISRLNEDDDQSTSKIILSQENLYYLETDFILLIKSQDINKPRVFIEYNPITDTNCLMLTLVPTFKHKSTKPNSTKMELIFIIDSSRSMKGVSIEKATKTLQCLLLSLPESLESSPPEYFFNVISIGHEKFDNFFEKSRPSTKKIIDEAIKKVQKITAKGGTHLYETLKWVFEFSLSDTPTSVILFSDFETSHVDRIVELIKCGQAKQKDLRIFSIGMNNSISHYFIDSVVRCGKGYAQYVSNSEEMNRKSMIMLRNSLYPPIADYKITWTTESNEESHNNGTKFQQVPLNIPELYIGVRFIVYCILSKDVKPCETITLKSKSQGPLPDLESIKPISLHGSKIHTLAAKKLIQEIEHSDYYPNNANNKEYVREQIVHIAKSYNLSSKYTSIELDDSLCNELNVPKENINTSLKRNLTNKNIQLPDLHSLYSTAANLSYLKNVAPQHEGDWKDKYIKAREYLSKQIGNKLAESEELDEFDELDEKLKQAKGIFNDKDKNEVNEKAFPLDDFYIKSAASESVQNLVISINRNSFVPWGPIKNGTKVIIAQQKSDISQDGYQLWRHEDGWLINKKTNLCLEVESAKEGICLSVHHKRSLNEASNQRWIFTPEGRIALKNNPKFVIEVLSKEITIKDGSRLFLVNTKSKNFKNGLNSKFVIIRKECLDDTFIGVVKLELASAKDLKNIDPSVKGKSYVRVFDDDKKIVAQTNFIDNNLNPVWNEVHYLPVKKIGNKFLLEVVNYKMKDKSLGDCYFEITRDLVKESTQKCWAKLSIEGQIHYRAKFFSIETLPQPTPEFIANFKEKSFNLSTLYFIITLQASDGSFLPSNRLANLFGYESPGKLFDLYKSHCNEDHVLKINQTAWSTSIIMWFLQSILKEYQSEWLCVYKRAKQYIRKEIHYDLEAEKILLSIGEMVINERFDINVK